MTDRISESLRLAQHHVRAARSEAEKQANQKCGRSSQEVAAMAEQLELLDLWLRTQRELCEDIDYHRERGEAPDYVTPRLQLSYRPTFAEQEQPK